MPCRRQRRGGVHFGCFRVRQLRDVAEAHRRTYYLLRTAVAFGVASAIGTASVWSRARIRPTCVFPACFARVRLFVDAHTGIDIAVSVSIAALGRACALSAAQDVACTRASPCDNFIPVGAPVRVGVDALPAAGPAWWGRGGLRCGGALWKNLA